MDGMERWGGLYQSSPLLRGHLIAGGPLTSDSLDGEGGMSRVVLAATGVLDLEEGRARQPTLSLLSRWAPFQRAAEAKWMGMSEVLLRRTAPHMARTLPSSPRERWGFRLFEQL